ncbi:MAG: SDR family oxidoreductase [Planctomycetaceae bacterium]
MPYLLMTGATGLVGRHVLRNLLQADERVAVIVRDGKLASAADRVNAILRHFEDELDHALPRPVVIAGDLCSPGAGLNGAPRRWIEANCHRVLHCAASMTFRKDNHGEPLRTNVEGTQTLLELCRQCGLREFHHVSTAYICGLRDGRILESEVDLGQRLGNVYEESKLRAEKLIRAAEWLDQVTVYRPASVVGDSRTGYVTNFHGFYLPLQLAFLMASQVSVADMNERFLSSLGLRGDEGKNLVPVDWVAAAISHLLEHPDLHGQTYHLASPAPVPVSLVQQVIQHAIERFHPNPLRGLVSRVDLSAHQAMFQQYMQVYESHWRNDPTFDLTHTRRALPHLPCPAMDYDTLMRIARYPMERNFTVMRHEEVVRDFDMGRHLQRLVAAGQSLTEAPSERVGLQVNGNGGGQWQLLVEDGRLAGADYGLPKGDSARLYLTAATFRSLMQRDVTIEDSLNTGRVLVENSPAQTATLVPLLTQLITA